MFGTSSTGDNKKQKLQASQQQPGIVCDLSEQASKQANSSNPALPCRLNKQPSSSNQALILCLDYVSRLGGAHTASTQAASSRHCSAIVFTSPCGIEHLDAYLWRADYDAVCRKVDASG